MVDYGNVTVSGVLLLGLVSLWLKHRKSEKGTVTREELHTVKVDLKEDIQELKVDVKELRGDMEGVAIGLARVETLLQEGARRPISYRKP